MSDALHKRIRHLVYEHYRSTGETITNISVEWDELNFCTPPAHVAGVFIACKKITTSNRLASAMGIDTIKANQ